MDKEWSKSSSSDSYGNSKLSNYSKKSKSNDSNDKPSLNKRAQVYSTYIETNELSVVGTTQKSVDAIKKPRLNEKKLQRLNSSEKIETFNELNIDMNLKNNSYDNMNCDLKNSFIGLNNFNCKNVFMDFIEQELILICLNENNQLSKNNFCFKGKCCLALLHGAIEINGFNLKRSVDNPQNSDKKEWYDIYSPETNSFVCILNQSIPKNDKNEPKFNFEHVLSRMTNIASLNITDKLKNCLEKYLNINQFSFDTSSLIFLKPLRAQLCNYLSYFENFQNVYQSFSNLTSDMKNNEKIDEVEKNFQNMGIFPVPSDFFNAIHITSNEEKNFIKSIIDSNNFENWNKESLVIMAAGGKDVGKSTFLRYTVNSLLNKYKTVAYLDCDPGQCEFTLSTCISLSLIREPLLGPPHTHISHSNNDKTCYFLGHLSPNDVPGLYLECLRKCLNDYMNFKLSVNLNNTIPLVINTMGWNQGLGLCLLKESILLFKPNFLVQLNHQVEANKNMPLLDKNWLQSTDGWPPSFKKSNKALLYKDNIRSKLKSHEYVHIDTMEIDDSNLNSDINYQLIVMKSGAPFKSNKFQLKSPQKRFSARDHRNIAIIAYFSALFDSKSFFTPINYLRPYKIAWSKLTLYVNHAKIEYDQLLRVFNASLVGLCHIDPKYIKRKEENHELPGYLSSIYDEENSLPIVYKCYGFGIIRGINTETKEFYILTPESIEVLNKVNLLSKGMLNLPLEFFYEQDSETPCPYVSFFGNLQQSDTDLNVISNEPTTRKYLIHQNMSQLKQQLK